MSQELRPEDMATALAWLDGELAPDARQRFELRLAQEPELARAVEACAATDDWLRARSPSGARPPGRLRPLLRVAWTAALLAAGLLLFLLGRALLPAPPVASPFTVALVPSDESASAFTDRIAALRGLRPRGFDELRGGASETNVEPAEFLRRAGDALPELAQAADAPAAEAGFFLVPLGLPAGAEPVEAALIAVPEVGAELRLWPEDPPPAPAAALGPGLHWLPRAPFALARAGDGAEEVRYSRGFLVPVGCRSLVVLVAVRPAREAGTDDLATLAAGWGRELVPVAPGTQAREVERWRGLLERQGFALRELAVREP